MDPVQEAARERELASLRAKELIAAMDKKSFEEAQDTVLDVRELEQGWLEVQILIIYHK